LYGVERGVERLVQHDVAALGPSFFAPQVWRTTPLPLKHRIRKRFVSV
jgi:hypothetical protein